MIKSVSIKNNFLKNDSALISNNTINLSLSQPWNTGLVIEEISGLGPVKANINCTDLATMDGAIFNSARQETRNIIFKFKLIETWSNGKINKTIEDVRHLCNTIFPPKEKVILYFETDSYNLSSIDRRLFIEGYVESNEPTIFTDEEEQQVSIICPYPYFKGMNSYNGRSEEPTPEFQFLLKDGSYATQVNDNDTTPYISRSLTIGSNLKNCYMLYSFPPDYDIDGKHAILFSSIGKKTTTTEQKNNYNFINLGKDSNGNPIKDPDPSLIPDELWTTSLSKETITIIRLLSTFDYVNGRIVKYLRLQTLVNGDVIYETNPWLVTVGFSGIITFSDYVGTVTEIGDNSIISKLTLREIPQNASFIPYSGDGTFEIGSILPIDVVNILYNGEIKTGAIFTIHATGPVSNIRITNLSSEKSMRIDTSKISAITGSSETDLIANDLIRLSTVYNNKYIKLYRNGVEYQILGCLEKDTDWLELQDGDNAFISESETGSNNFYMDIRADLIYNGI